MTYNIRFHRPPKMPPSPIAEFTWTCLPYDAKTRRKYPDGLTVTRYDQDALLTARLFESCKQAPIHEGDVICGGRIDRIVMKVPS